MKRLLTATALTLTVSAPGAASTPASHTSIACSAVLTATYAQPAQRTLPCRAGKREVHVYVRTPRGWFEQLTVDQSGSSSLMFYGQGSVIRVTDRGRTLRVTAAAVRRTRISITVTN